MTPQQGQMGLDILLGLGSGYAQQQQVDAQNIVNQANTIAENLMRSANNQLAAAQGSLKRYNQSITNKRVMESAGSQAEAALVNYRRQRDVLASSDFEQQIQMAEQEGRQAASAAASGLTGGVVDMVNSTSALRNERIKQATLETFKAGDYDAAKQQGQIMRAGMESLDTDSVIDNLDYNISVFSKQERGGNWFGDILGAVASKPQNTANVFSFMSTPGDSYLIGQGSTYNGRRSGM